MKVKFTCTCHESFNVEAKYLKSKTSLVCPNCGNEFPNDKFEDLRTSIVKIDEIQQSLSCPNAFGEVENNWHFTL